MRNRTNCKRCDVVLTDENGRRQIKPRKDGTRGFQTLCKKCERIKVREWRRSKWNDEEYRQKRREEQNAYNKSSEKRKIAMRATASKRRKQVSAEYDALSDIDKARMTEIYIQAKRLGSDYHVDHIVPLSRGGKHHPDNLQIVTAEYNLKKGNRWIG